MNKIFISYRRDDTAPVCGRIYDRLCMRFGRENVFKDVEGIPLGVNFEEYVGSVVAQCAVQLVIIGPGWITASTDTGDRRLEDPHDLVRIEVEAALKRNIPVIPVMVQGATLPHSSKLPPSMQGLIGRNGLPVGNDPHFDPDMNLLIASLDSWLAAPNPSIAGSASTSAWPGPMTSPGLGMGASPTTPMRPNMPPTSTWQGAPAPMPTPMMGSPTYGAGTPLAPGAGAPRPPAYVGVMTAPQAMAAPPMMPPTPVSTGGPTAMRPSSKRRMIPIMAVAGVVIALVIVGVLVLRAITNVPSVTGTWYGRSVWSSSSTGASASFEVYMNLNENGGNISGTGSLCDNKNGAANGLGSFDVTGTHTNAQVTISFTDTTDNVQLNMSGPLSSDSMSLNGNLTSSTGPVSTQTNLQHGSQSDYQTACAVLPPIPSGTGG